MRRLLSLVSATVLISGCFGPRAVLVTDLLDVEMVLIEGGAFEMGDSFEALNEDALPVHSVDIESFYISRFEITFDQYDAFARAARRPLPQPDERERGSRAVVDVSWDEAMAFCAYVGGRLPTESEWEYAAAGGSRKQEYAGTNEEEEVGRYASYRENSAGMSLAVGQKEPNLFGLYDMSGNVGEWVNKYYEKYPETGQEPIYNDAAVRDMRIVRGGGISSELPLMRTYWRAGTLRHIRTPSVGFRCARDARRTV